MFKTMFTLYAFMDGPVMFDFWTSYLAERYEIYTYDVSKKLNKNIDIQTATAADRVSLLTTDRLISLPSGC